MSGSDLSTPAGRRRAAELHKPQPYRVFEQFGDGETDVRCAYCRQDWPCDTRTELDRDEDDDG